MECNNRMFSTSLDAENNQCKNCITLASRVRSLSSEIESLREKIEKIECNNMPSSKPIDESVGKPLNIQIQKLNADVQSLMEAFRELSAKVSKKPLASDLVKRNLQGALNSKPGGLTSTPVQNENLSNQISKAPVFGEVFCH